MDRDKDNVGFRDPDSNINKKKSKNNLDFYYYILWLLFDYLSMKTDVNVPSKSNKQNKLWKKNLIFVGILSTTDEKSWIRTRIRIHTKMSRIPNTGSKKWHLDSSIVDFF